MIEEIRFPAVESILRGPENVRTAPFPRAPRSGISDRDDRQHKLNARLSVFLCIVVVLVPVPIGGVRPAIWALSAMAIGAAGTWYAIQIARVGGTLRVSLRDWSVEALLSLLLLGFLLGQVLPLGPFAVQTPEAGIVTAHTISLSPGDTLLMFLRQLGYILFFFLVMQVAVNRRRAWMLLRVLFTVVAVYAVLGLVSLSWDVTLLGMEKTSYAGYATGPFINRNSFATFLAAGFVMGVALLLHALAGTDRPSPELWKRVAYGSGLVAAIALVTAALLATGSRMGVFAGLFGGAITMLFSATERRRLFGGVLVAVVLGGGLVLAYGAGLLERVIDLRQAAEGRSELYSQVWQAIVMRPWLGYGGGSFAIAFPLFQHPPLLGDVVWEKAHSSYLALWFELGLVAGSVPLLLIASIAARIVFSLRRSASRDVAALAALGTIVVFAVHSLVDFSMEIPGNTYLFLALAGLGASWSGRALREGGQQF